MVILLLAATGAWADSTVTITKQMSGEKSDDAGTVTSSVTDDICTLTVTPADGNYATVDHITAYATVTGEMAQSRGRAIGINEGVITVTATDSNADPSGVTTYTFTMPTDGSNVKVTVDFQTRIDINGATATLAETSLTYTGEALEPAVTVTDGETVLTAGKDYTVTYSDNIAIGTAKATITGKGYYKGTVVLTFEIIQPVADNSYGIYVNNILITEDNKDDVLNDGDFDNGKAPSVLYDSDSYTMVLTKTENINIKCIRTDSLKIYVMYDCSGELIQSLHNSCKLIFTTDGVYPGELTLTNPNGAVVSGFGEIRLDPYVEAANLDTGSGNVRMMLKPITDERVEKAPIDDLVDAENNQAAQQTSEPNAFISLIKNNFLYSYDMNSESGPDPSDNSFIMNRACTFEEIENAFTLLEESYADYAKKVCGITCMLPPGEILLKVDAVCMGDMQLYLGVKDLKPVRIMPDSVYNILLTETTPVILFAYEAAETSGTANHRIGRKTTAGIGVCSITITPTQINSSNSVSRYSSNYPTSTLENAAQNPSNDKEVTDENTIEVIDQQTAEEIITGITPPNAITIDLRKNSVPIFDLQGRRVTYPCKPGIYITQGKQVVIK